MWTPGEQRQTECATYLFTCITVNEIWHQGFRAMPWPRTRYKHTHTHTTSMPNSWWLSKNAHGETCCTDKDNKQTHYSDNLTQIKIYAQSTCTKLNPNNKTWEHSTDAKGFCNAFSYEKSKAKSLNASFNTVSYVFYTNEDPTHITSLSVVFVRLSTVDGYC